MANIYARSARSGKVYSVDIAGTQPTPEEQAYIEQRIDDIEGYGPVTEAPVAPGEPEGNLISRSASAFGRDFLTSFTELPAGLVGSVEANLGYVPGSTNIGEAAQNISEAGREGVEYLLGESQGTTAEKYFGALGSLASFLVPGTAAAKVAKVAGAGQKVQRASALGGGAAMGSALGSKDAINRVANQLAQGKDVSDEDFITATQLGGLIGLSEILPLQRVMGDAIRILRKVPAENQEEAVKAIGKRLRRAVTTGTFEGIQEAGAGIAQDLVEKNLYNPEANIGATADEEFIYGGSAGATLSFLVDSIRGRQLNKLDKANRQLAEDLADEGAETAEKAKNAADSLRTDSELGDGQPILLAAPTQEVADEVDEVPDVTKQRLESLGLNPEEETQLAAQAARERTTGFATIPLDQLPEQEAAAVRTARIRRGATDPDAPADINEVREFVGEAAYAREFKKQKPVMWGESDQNPRNQKSFSPTQIERVVEAVRSSGKASVPVIRAAAKTGKDPVPLSVVREIQTELERRGVTRPVAENKWEVMTERVEEEAPSAPLRRRLNEIEAEAGRAHERKAELRDQRDAAREAEDQQQESTLDQQIARQDQIIGDLDAERSQVEAQVNQIDPENPIVNTIDEQQREINQARRVAEVSPEKPLTDEYARKRQNVANALRRYLNRLGLGNRVDLVTQNVILPEGVDKEAKMEGIEDQLGREGIIEGFEQAGENGRRIIAVAMEIYDPNLTEEQLAQKIGGVLNHEIIHALRGLGVFTDKEWNTLTEAAKNKKRVRYVNGRLQEREYTYYERAERIYGAMGADQDLIAEEAVAEMFRDWADGKLKVAGKPQSLLRRIIRFFTSVFRSHSDAGFRKASDIFQNIVTSDKDKQIGRRDKAPPTPRKSNRKFSTAGKMAGFLSPDRGNVERINQDFKQVTKRVNELTEASQALEDGKITIEQYDQAVNKYKPIVPYETVPAPETRQDILNAISGVANDPRTGEKRVPKSTLVGLPSQMLQPGEIVRLRLDIPSYKDHGVWTVSYHRPNIKNLENMSFVESDGRAMVDGKFQPSKVNIPQNLIAGEVIGYEPTGVIQNAMFGMSEDAALNIATGKKGKSTIATMQGSHVPMSPEQAFKMAQEALIDPSFVQVGMDPERHSYFYDRETTQPVVAADLVIQVGPLVLAKNPTFAGKKSFKYSITYPAGINDISQFLTEQEIDEFLVGRKGDIENKAARLSEILTQVPSAENMAAVAIGGQAKKGWYRNSAKAIIEIFGLHDARRFTALLAATSPQTSVESNAINTLNIWANWNNAGRPQDRESILRIMGESVQGDKGEQSILPAWVNNSLRALSAPFGQEMQIVLSGPKVNSFMLNLVNELDEVTNDTWMANYALTEQDLFKGAFRADVKDDISKIGMKGPGYLAFNVRTRQAAQAASDITGDSWSPAEIQETVWSLSKALLEKRKRLKGDQRGMTARQLLEEGIITDQQVADVPDFATLFTEGVYGRILEDAGYGRQLDTVRGFDEGVGVSVDARPVYSAENIQADPNFIRRELGEFADRLEILARDGKQALRKFSITVPPEIQGGRRAAINARIGAGFNGRIFDKQRGSRTLNGYNVVATYKVRGNAARTYNEQDVSTPLFMELAPTPQSALQFSEAINSAKSSLGKFGESVFVYPEEDYADMRLFLTEDGTGGFALKPTDMDGVIDIVSVFNSNAPSAPYARDGGPHRQLNYPMIRLATEEGGNILDAFDIYLPSLYSANGFKVRSRLKWDDEQAPDGWDKETFGRFQNGEPDVVFMYYQPDRTDVYVNGSQEGEMFDDYMDAVNAQMGAAVSNTGVNRFRDIEVAEAERETNPEEFLTEQDEADLADIKSEVQRGEVYDARKLSATPPKPSTFIPAPLKTKRQLEYGYIVEGGRKVPVYLNYGQDVDLGPNRTSGGFGLKHMIERGHVQEFIDAGFPSAEKALFDMMYRWGAQGFQDGADVIMFPDGAGSLRLEWDAGKKGRVIASIKRIGVGGKPAYTFRTGYPEKKKKLSLAYAAIDPDRIQNQIPVAQESIMYSRASRLLAKVLGYVYEPNRAEEISEDFLRKFQDSMLPVGRMIDDLKAQGATITDGMDAYLKEELYHGITGSKIADNEKNLYTPMIELVKGFNVSDGLVDALKARSRFVREALESGRAKNAVLADAFLYARHAKERNAYIRTIDPDNLSGSGMSDADADVLLNFFNRLDTVERNKFTQLGAAADNIIKNTNDIRVAGGLTPDFTDGQDVIDADTGEVVASPNYSSYVPLRGIMDPTNESNEEYSGRPASRPKFGARGREDQRMLGRFELARDIMANLMLQNQNAIIRSERNRVGQSFLELIRNEPNLTSEYARIVAQKPTVRVLQNGVVRTRPDPNLADRDDILVVKESGQEVYIQIDDPRIALAMKGSTGLSPQHTGFAIKALGKINRYLSNINTSWNPEFLITNMVRDLQTAGVNINQYEMNGLTTDTLKGVPSALKGIKRSIVDGDASSEWAQLYEDFVRAGGQNATNMMGDLNDQVSNLQNLLQEISNDGAKGLAGKTKAGFFKLLNTMENYNTVVENGVRVAAYKALLDRGFTKERAAQAARNVTVNFAKGGEYKTFMNSVYLFYNAALQGSFAMLNAALRSGKVRKAWVGMVVVGLLQDQLNAMLSDEDEDGELIYDKIPDYIQEKNLIIMDPFGITDRSFYSIPLPYGLNMAVNMGRAMSRTGRGGYTAQEGGATIVGTILDTLNPIGDTPRIPGLDKDFEFEDILTTVSPTVTDPMVQYLTNSDFARNPIYKETSQYGVGSPASQTHFSTTGPAAKFVANFIRKPFGLGDASDVRPGFIEVSPDTLEFWFEFATGGVGRFVKLTGEFGASTAPKVLAGEFEEEMLRSTPFVRKLIGSVSEREDLAGYVEKRDRVLLARKDLIDARKKGDTERAERILSAYREEIRISGVINALNNARNKLTRKIRQIEDNPRIPDDQKEKLIELMVERRNEIIARANKIMKDL